MNPSIERMKFQPGGRVLMTLSDGSKVRTSENTVLRLSLASGVIVTPEIMSQLEACNNYEACLKKTLDLLSRRPHGTVELRRKLMRSQKFDLQDINEVMLEMERLGYLDDEQFCRLFIEDSFNLKPGDGPAKIRQKLMSKGFKRPLIDSVLSEMARDPEEEYDTVLKTAQKKWMSYRGDIMLHKKKEKLYRFLAGRGFSSQIISRAVREVSQKTQGD